MSATRTINPIKKALIEAITAKKDELGIKSIKQDISPQDIVEACQKELAYFPGLIVNYAGRIPSREGSIVGGSLKTDMTFAIFVTDRNVQEAFVSGEKCIDVIEDLVELIDGQRLTKEQKTPFEFAADQLMHQDEAVVIYQLLFRTQTVHARRS